MCVFSKKIAMMIRMVYSSLIFHLMVQTYGREEGKMLMENFIFYIEPSLRMCEHEFLLEIDISVNIFCFKSIRMPLYLGISYLPPRRGYRI